MKSGRYLKYAIGEIFLVVIGILIALSINNWNEGRKQKAKTEAILTQVIGELKLDIGILRSVNNGYAYKDSLVSIYKQSDYTKNLPTNLDTTELIDLARTYMPFEIHDRGFQLLTNHTDELDNLYSEDMERLIIIYQNAAPQVNFYMKKLLDNLQDHKEHRFKNYAWYSERSLWRNPSPEEFEYYKFDPIYKNYLSVYKEMYINIVSNARWFNNLAIDVISNLEKKMDLDNSIENLIPKAPKGMIESMIGTYRFEGGNFELILELRNNQLYNSTYQGTSFFGKAHDTKENPGKLRYLGDSTFHYNSTRNLILNADGSISIFSLISKETFTSIEKN